jgi:hypothetical protein
VADHDLSACATRVAASPTASRRVFSKLAELTGDAKLRTDPKWEGTWVALDKLVRALEIDLWRSRSAPRRFP